MSVYLKEFSTHSEYEAYIASEGKILPNVSICEDTKDVHYNPFVETRVVAKFNVTSTSSPTKIANITSIFSEIEIDDSKQPSVTTGYTFDTVGEHTIKYTLKNPTSIGEGAFQSCSGLISIDIPSGVTSIGYSTFNSCISLTSVDIPNSVTSIGSRAFDNCTSLTSCTIGSGVTSIGDTAFYHCSGLTSIDIPSGVTSIGNSAFNGCSRLTSIVSNAATAPTIQSATFYNVKTGGTLTVPQGSSGYDTWMQNINYYLGLYGWTKVEQ